ncbi:MAG: hypothetical protein AAB897_01475 [Patescibacteria group bacterium]
MRSISGAFRQLGLRLSMFSNATGKFADLNGSKSTTVSGWKTTRSSGEMSFRSSIFLKIISVLEDLGHSREVRVQKLVVPNVIQLHGFAA